jgi:CRP/FNR family transcriptional regulator, dissimilatory nitrate respiration regulator
VGDHAVFPGLPGPARFQLLARGIERRFSADQVLFTAGSAPRGLYVVLEGEVRVLRGSGGRQHVIHVEGPGGTLGEVALFDGAGYPATAVASRPTRVLVFTRDAIRAAMADDPDVALYFLKRFAGRMRHLIERLDQLAARSVTARLAAWLAERDRSAGGGDFDLGRSQMALAEELGTVREVLVRSLRLLREEGILVRTGRGRYRVSDRAGLAARGGSASA